MLKSFIRFTIIAFIRFTIIAITLLSATPVLAQFDSYYGDYYIQHYTDENGLPQNSINDLLFDKDGFLWLASQAGLVRYDGRIFKLYDLADKPAMKSNVLFLSSDSTGGIYLQTDDHSLYCYKNRNSQSPSHVITPALQKLLLVNTRQQLFDFSNFLHKCPGAGESE